MKFKFAVFYSFLLLICCAVNAANDPLTTQRHLFKTWEDSYATLSIDEQKKQLVKLADYSLYPYAQYQYFLANLSTVTAKEIELYVKYNQDTPLADDLMKRYIELLTKQKDWATITTLSIDGSLESRCRYQYALYQQGKTQQALNPIKDIWLSGKDLASACDPVFDVWSASGDKTANTILLRIGLTLENGNTKLAKYLTEQLPDNYKTLKRNLLALYDNPTKLADFSKNISPTAFSRKVVMSSFSRLVSKDADSAKMLIPTLVKQQKLNQEQEIKLQRAIAVNYFKSSATKTQIQWRDQFIAQQKDVVLIERRIRLSLKENALDDVAYWLNLLPKTEQAKDEWRYWRAMILMKDGHQEEGISLLKQITESRGFYAMYSAQKLEIPYQYNFDYFVTNHDSAAAESAYLTHKYAQETTIKRVMELRYWQKLSEASREWRHYLYHNIKDRDYAQLARYANYQGWGEQSVQATIAGKLWDNWLERFPVVHKALFEKSLEDKSISISYAMAIARQESALESTVQSPAGARGLMQLMPATAKDSAKKLHMQNYHSSDQLYDPKINIELGTYYLNYVYQLYDNNRILASAAYNAGPNRVKIWLQESSNQLDPIAFIESIPFTETRNYVKNVLVYEYIYRLIQQGETKDILTQHELARMY